MSKYACQTSNSAAEAPQMSRPFHRSFNMYVPRLCAFICNQKILQQVTIRPRTAFIRSFAATTLDDDEQFLLDHPVPPPYGSIPKEDREYLTGDRVLPNGTVCTIDEKTTQILGDLPLPSGQVLVTDPCYEVTLGERIWCNAVIECVPHDSYQVRMVTEGGEKYHGLFVSFGVYHPEYSDVIPNEIAHDNIGVDSASISFSDKSHKVCLHEYLEECHDIQPGVYDWQGGKIATTWCDDGGYLLLVGRNEEDKIVAAELMDPLYLTCDHDDDEEDDDDDEEEEE